jgi:hypothetical protein
MRPIVAIRTYMHHDGQVDYGEDYGQQVAYPRDHDLADHWQDHGLDGYWKDHGLADYNKDHGHEANRPHAENVLYHVHQSVDNQLIREGYNARYM